MVLTVAETDLLESLRGPASPFVPGDAGIGQGQFYVLDGRAASEQVEGLEDEADVPSPDMRALIGVKIHDVPACKGVGTRGWAVQ
jgi:hypothetical protein